MNEGYTPPERSDAPAVCPLIDSCTQYNADLEEYERLKKKWTAYAKSQPPEKIEFNEKGKKVKMTLSHVSPVEGTQVFHLEYAERLEAKKERLEKMCPHFKRDVLGLPVMSDPPYLQCHIFSRWYFEQKKG